MMFSVITVCFNNPQELEKTLKSIQKQNNDELEVIVINGGDKNLIDKVIHSFSHLAATVVTEPDDGIYDAMNKGAAIAKGDYVIYLNSGDAFCDGLVLSKVKEEVLKNKTTKIFYGLSISDYGYKKVLCEAKSGEHFLGAKFYELGFSHQSIFVAKDILGDCPFDLEYKVAADFEFLYPKLRAYNNCITKLDFPVSIFATGGVSDLDKTILNKEKKMIYHLNNPASFTASIHFSKLIFMEKIKRRVRPLIRKVQF